MKKNMGMLDKVIRVIIAVVIGILYYMEIITGTLGLVLVILAAVFVLTSLIGVCPLYMPFGCSTAKKKEE